jgi:hypothetical protein
MPMGLGVTLTIITYNAFLLMFSSLSEWRNSSITDWADSKEFTYKDRKILIRTFTPDSFAVRQNISVEFNGSNPHAIKDGPNTVAVLWTYREKDTQPSSQWGLKRYDLTTGQCIHTETIESRAF